MSLYIHTLSISLHTHTLYLSTCTPLSLSLYIHTLSLSLYILTPSLCLSTVYIHSFCLYILSLSISIHAHILPISLSLSLFSLNAHFLCDYTVHTLYLSAHFISIYFPLFCVCTHSLSLYIYSLHSPAISLQSKHTLPIYLSPSLFSLYSHFCYYPITTQYTFSLFLCTDSHSLYTLNSLPFPL